jgi:DNA polymerase-3 subunit epsilon
MTAGARTGDRFGPWHEHSVVVFDVETTGISPENDRIVEVGLARFERGRLVKTWGTLINPGMEIPKAASEIHGITNDDVANAPSFIAALPHVLSITRDAWPCAYNASFDKKFWSHELSRLSGLDVTSLTIPMFDPSFQWVDPVVWSRHHNGIWKGNKLTQACERYGISIENAHRATDDAVATGKLLFAMARENHIKTCTMSELLRRQDLLDREHDADRAAWFAKKGIPYERRF